MIVFLCTVAAWFFVLGFGLALIQYKLILNFHSNLKSGRKCHPLPKAPSGWSDGTSKGYNGVTWTEDMFKWFSMIVVGHIFLGFCLNGGLGAFMAFMFWVFIVVVPMIFEYGSRMMVGDNMYGFLATKCFGMAGFMFAPIFYLIVW